MFVSFWRVFQCVSSNRMARDTFIFEALALELLVQEADVSLSLLLWVLISFLPSSLLSFPTESSFYLFLVILREPSKISLK